MVQQENYKGDISRIGETDTSSTDTSCDDSKYIDDRYDKIVGLIIPPEALKQGRHASHVCQQERI